MPRQTFNGISMNIYLDNPFSINLYYLFFIILNYM